MNTFSSHQKMNVVTGMTTAILAKEEEAYQAQILHLIQRNNQIQAMQQPYFIYRGKLFFAAGFNKASSGVRQPYLHISLHQTAAELLRNYRQYELTTKNVVRNYMTEVVNFTDVASIAKKLIPEVYWDSFNDLISDNYPVITEFIRSIDEVDAFLDLHRTALVQIKLRQIDQLLQVP